ncbi:MAG: hypothetical protein AAF673_03955, partial [Pseudomonadota bacterium]
LIGLHDVFSWIGLSSIPGLKKIIASLIGLLSKDKAIMSYMPYFNPSNIIVLQRIPIAIRFAKRICLSVVSELTNRTL